MLDLYYNEKSYYILGVFLLPQHETVDYVTIILAINIQNGDIFWEDLIINEFKSGPAHHSEMTEEPSYSVKQCLC